MSISGIRACVRHPAIVWRATVFKDENHFRPQVTERNSIEHYPWFDRNSEKRHIWDWISVLVQCSCKSLCSTNSADWRLNSALCLKPSSTAQIEDFMTSPHQKRLINGGVRMKKPLPPTIKSVLDPSLPGSLLASTYKYSLYLSIYISNDGKTAHILLRHINEENTWLHSVTIPVELKRISSM